MITEYEKAYLAGLIDGEGCIYVDRWKDKSNKTGNYTYVLRLKISMSCKKTIQWVFDTVSKEFECNFHMEERMDYRYTNRKVMYAFKFSKNLIKLLRYVYPYMVTKKDRVEWAFEWEKTLFINNRIGRNGTFQKIPMELLDKKEEIYKKFKVLNKTGR